MRMTRWPAVALAIAALVVVFPAAGAARRAAQRLCVGAGNGCYATLQDALDHASDGDRIQLGHGTFAGGVTVLKSVTIEGAGPAETIISGGGPVVAIGQFGDLDADKRTVSITGVTITGGVTGGLPGLPFIARGGGIDIRSGPSGTVGATVTIRNSVITGNRVAPQATIDSGEPCPGGADCRFALAIGGGIVDVGRLTLIHSVVSGNMAGGPNASEAAGGGIWTATNGGPGALTLIDSTVAGNTASVVAPNGRFAQGGGVHVQDGEALVVRDSAISGNTASVRNTFGPGVDMFAGFGGLHTGGSGTAVIENTRITGNVASADDPNAPIGVADAALGIGISDFCACGETLDLKGSVIRRNHTILHAASSDNGPSGGVVEIDGQATVTDTEISDNTTSFDNDGSAWAFGTFFTIDYDAGAIVVRNSAIRDNTVTVRARSGPATIWGAGIMNAGPLELHGVDVSRNAGWAFGDSGVAQGGGIWNGRPFDPGDPAPQLTLDHTRVTRNTLFGSPGVTVRGGGLYTPGFQVSAIDTVIERNRPDDCFGC